MRVILFSLGEIALSLLVLLLALRAAAGRLQRTIVLCSWIALWSALVVIILTLLLVPFRGSPVSPLAARILTDTRALMHSEAGVLVTAAWTFAVYDAMQLRRRGWMTLIIVAAGLSILAAAVLVDPSALLLRTVTAAGRTGL